MAVLGRLLCLSGAGCGAIGLLGCITGANALTTIVPGQPPMGPNTALSVVLAGVAGALRHRPDARGIARALSVLAAVAVLIVGVATLAEYLLGVDLHIDQLLMPVPGPLLHPGRASPPTAVALILLGAALLLVDVRPQARVRPSQWLALAAGMVAFTALLGQLFGGGPVYELSGVPVIGVAVPTALGLLLTAVGLLLERPGAGILRVASSRGPGGFLLRRLTPVAIVAPALLGLMVERIVLRAGTGEYPLVFAVLAVVLTMASLTLLALTAVSLNRTHETLELVRSGSRDLIERASDAIFVADLEGRYTDVNGAACGMLGYSREELIGKNIVDLIGPAEWERLLRVKQRLLAGEVDVSDWALRRKDGTFVPVEVSAKILPDGRWQGIVRDISERKQAQERARQSQERLELVLKGADLASWDWNVKTGEVIFNSRWAEMLGYRPEEVRPHVDSWISGVHPDDWPRVGQAVDACLQGLIPDYETEHRLRTRSGDWIWIFDRGRVFARDEQGKPVRMVGTSLDITDRRRAEEALRLSEAKSSGILAISADAIISIDEQQRITMFNGGAEKIFGYRKEEVLGAPLDLLIPEPLRARHRQHVEGFAASEDVARRMGDQRNLTISGLRKDGTVFPADGTISRLDVGGTRLLTVAVRDITEQKRNEREQTFLVEVGTVLGSSLEYEETLARVAQLAVRDLADLCVVDMLGEDGEARRVTAACRDPARAWICDRLKQMRLDRSRPHLIWTVLESKRTVLKQGLSPEMIALFSHDQDEERGLRALSPRSLLVVPLMAREKLLGVIGLVSAAPSRDFGPAEVRLAEQLAERAALAIEKAHLYRIAQAAVRARDELLGIVAHDLRNPLSRILLQTEMLRRRGHEPERRTQTPVTTIERAAKLMNRLIQDLLDITRMEAGRMSVDQVRVPAGQVVADSVEAEQPVAASASIELRSEVAPNLPEVWADRDRLLQVFENLITNAIKFTGPGGSVVVGAVPRPGEVLFWVADTGPGISLEDRPHLFDKFWQARKDSRRGAGLGLPIVKGLVEAHAGRVWVESTPGSGSTFFFTIPAAPGPERWRQQPVSHSA